jgi:hypothetical protein
VNYLDEAGKADYSEDGSSYGIEPQVYQMLAECAMALWHAAGVEPVTLEALPDGRPGAICTLYSPKAAYTISIEVGQLVLSFAPLDSALQPVEMYRGRADLITDWGYVQHLVRNAEDPGYYERHMTSAPGEIKRAWTRKASDLW